MHETKHSPAEYDGGYVCQSENLGVQTREQCTWMKSGGPSGTAICAACRRTGHHLVSRAHDDAGERG